MAAPSEQASTSSVMLPSRKTYLMTLSAIAFASGLGVATVLTIRRGRRMRLEELQANASSSSSPDRAGSSSSLIKGKPPAYVPADEGARQSPLTLFKEMNKAAFGARRAEVRTPQPASQEIPSSLVRSSRGKQAKTSVFDSFFDVPPPSALMRAPPKGRGTVGDEQSDTPRTSKERQSEPEDETLESPVLLAAKAIGIATALVGTGALLAWEIGRRLLGVQSVDELVDRLADVIPSRTKDKPGSDASSDEDNSMQGRPLPLDEALDALDEAAKQGQAGQWVSILSRQLNAEREQDLEQRRQRLARQQGALRG